MEHRRYPLYFLILWTSIFIFCPLQFPFFDWKNEALLSIYKPVFKWISGREIAIFSDSLGFYWLVLFLVFFSGVLYLILKKRTENFQEKTQQLSRKFLLFCLFLIYAKYGLDKIMMLQFPRPEPNLMFTELRNFDKDLLFWTSMGTSRLYNLVSGGLEILGASCLLFQRTRRLGLLLLLLSAIYIVLLNFSFDIGVKLFTLILLGTLLTLNWMDIRFLFTYLLGFGEDKKEPKEKRLFLPILKTVAMVSILLYFMMLNQENSIKNPWQGAYESQETEGKKYIFINQQNMWIEQEFSGEREAYYILAQGKEEHLLENVWGEKRAVHFEKTKENLFEIRDDRGIVHPFKKINLTEMNLMQDEFRWVVE